MALIPSPPSGVLSASDMHARANDDLATLIRQRAGLERALAELVSDTIHFAQTAHQGHHTDVPGTWDECGRGVCPGIKRAIVRAKAMLEACQP